jgi:hypothetical protein
MLLPLLEVFNGNFKLLFKKEFEQSKNIQISKYKHKNKVQKIILTNDVNVILLHFNFFLIIFIVFFRFDLFHKTEGEIY